MIQYTVFLKKPTQSKGQATFTYYASANTVKEAVQIVWDDEGSSYLATDIMAKKTLGEGQIKRFKVINGKAVQL
jgi:hypothetical protein